MTQAHSLLLKEFELRGASLLTEEQLSVGVLRHIKALRVETGEHIEFLDGKGSIFVTRCSNTRPYAFEVLEHSQKTELSPALHLFLSPPRKDTLSQTLSQSTEMGVRRISFLKSDHNDLATRDFDKTIERAQRVLEASVEQCKAPFLPELSERFLSLSDFLSDHSSSSTVFFADEDLSREGLLGVQDESTLEADRKSSEWKLLIGPEGGWSDKERKLLLEMKNCRKLGLGPQILKVPTACVAALCLLQRYRLA